MFKPPSFLDVSYEFVVPDVSRNGTSRSGTLSAPQQQDLEESALIPLSQLLSSPRPSPRISRAPSVRPPQQQQQLATVEPKVNRRMEASISITAPTSERRSTSVVHRNSVSPRDAFSTATQFTNIVEPKKNAVKSVNSSANPRGPVVVSCRSAADLLNKPSLCATSSSSNSLTTSLEFYDE
ncbi:Hypothetical protein, putative [Bodo saltans]|uniref:Uncharacterized protein n=1 Tax=Bodo saltans TaxID=75058 RepID=A0A0S4J9J4_BODSA|nr:Hypothetical protein, putative [Bodo saltans]|eukprot:CUG86798.1 Hypothetical protein, putative [Bodo saltans]